VSGRRPPTLHDVRARRREILQILASRGGTNPRVFGSVARGDAVSESDVDLLVDFGPDTPSGFDYFGMIFDLQEELSAIVGRPVHVVRVTASSATARRILGEAVPL
jgi:predicted nucleotidyltransferase